MDAQFPMTSAFCVHTKALPFWFIIHEFDVVVVFSSFIERTNSLSACFPFTLVCVKYWKRCVCGPSLYIYADQTEEEPHNFMATHRRCGDIYTYTQEYKKLIKIIFFPLLQSVDQHLPQNVYGIFCCDRITFNFFLTAPRINENRHL